MRTALKRVMSFISLLLLLPLILLSRMEAAFTKRENLFQSLGQFLSLFPGRIGILIRRGYYLGTLAKCAWDIEVGFLSYFSHRGARISSRVSIGSFCIVGLCDVGADTMIGSKTSIISGKFTHVDEEGNLRRSPKFVMVHIGSRCWIGEGSILLDDLGDDCIVSAGSVVTKKAPPRITAVGNPARFVQYSAVHHGERASDHSPVGIAFVIETVAQEIGGTERQLLLLIDKVDKTRFAPHLVCLYGSPVVDALGSKIPVTTRPFRSLGHMSDYLNIVRLARDFRRRKIQIVQTHFRDGNIVGVLAARLAGVKVIISSRRNQGFWHNRKELFILSILNRWVTHWLANSNAIKEYTERVEHVPADRIRVIYNGFEPASGGLAKSVEKAGESLFAADAAPARPQTVIIVANLRDVKRIDVFVRAAAAVREVVPDTRFLVVGSGPLAASLKDLAHSLGLQGAVEFLGHRADVPALLSSCAAGVLCSDSEGLSNAIIEYMAAGLPVVCTNVGGNPELVVEGETGYLVPAGDHEALAAALVRVLREPSMARSMGAAGRERAHRVFGLERFVRETEEYYTELVRQAYGDGAV